MWLKKTVCLTNACQVLWLQGCYMRQYLCDLDEGRKVWHYVLVGEHRTFRVSYENRVTGTTINYTVQLIKTSKSQLANQNQAINKQTKTWCKHHHTCGSTCKTNNSQIIRLRRLQIQYTGDSVNIEKYSKRKKQYALTTEKETTALTAGRCRWALPIFCKWKRNLFKWMKETEEVQWKRKRLHTWMRFLFAVNTEEIQTDSNQTWAQLMHLAQENIRTSKLRKIKCKSGFPTLEFTNCKDV